MKRTITTPKNRHSSLVRRKTPRIPRSIILKRKEKKKKETIYQSFENVYIPPYKFPLKKKKERKNTLNRTLDTWITMNRKRSLHATMVLTNGGVIRISGVKGKRRSGEKEREVSRVQTSKGELFFSFVSNVYTRLVTSVLARLYRVVSVAEGSGTWPYTRFSIRAIGVNYRRGMRIRFFSSSRMTLYTSPLIRRLA